MYLIQTKKNSFFTDLNAQLADFGLQPKDWTLIQEGNRKIKITNNQHESFYFFGIIENQNGKTYWKNIQLGGL